MGGRRVITMVHWWSQKNVAALCQCGTVRTTSVVVFRRCSCWGWPGLTYDWHAAFVCLLSALICGIIRLCDDARYPAIPKGLPPIEEQMIIRTTITKKRNRRLLSTFMETKLPNKLLWYRHANVFVYSACYWHLDLSHRLIQREVKHFALINPPGSLYEQQVFRAPRCGAWMSDKVFRGNRGATGVFFIHGDHRDYR